MRSEAWFVRLAVAVAVVGAYGASAFAGGKLNATVKFEGDKPRRTVLKMDADAYCDKYHDKKVGSQDYLIHDDKVMNVVVYVKDGLGEDATFETPTEKAKITQIGCMYDPHVLAVQVGQKVTILNSDDTLHNIHSFPEKQRPFNFAQPKKGMEQDVDFKRDEFVKVKCDVHPWMSAYVAVFKDPFHAVTAKDGTCTIENLPPGDYTFGAWHEELGELEAKVTIADGAENSVEFTYKK